MRSAGCIVNDILDKEFDKKVFRTKNRPIASGKISIKLAIFMLNFMFIAFCILNFNNLHIISFRINATCFYISFNEKIYILASIIFRITFNYGLILGWTSIKEIDIIPILFILEPYFGH